MGTLQQHREGRKKSLFFHNRIKGLVIIQSELHVGDRIDILSGNTGQQFISTAAGKAL